MAKSVTCIFGGQTIGIDEAVKLRDERGSHQVDFRCVTCRNPVRAHRSGGHAQAHFEHFERNQECDLSDVR